MVVSVDESSHEPELCVWIDAKTPPRYAYHIYVTRSARNVDENLAKGRRAIPIFFYVLYYCTYDSVVMICLNRTGPTVVKFGPFSRHTALALFVRLLKIDINVQQHPKIHGAICWADFRT